jgi:hypothetical protein
MPINPSDLDEFRLWARFHLNLTDTEFYALLPFEFVTLVRHWNHQQEREKLTQAKLQYTVAASLGARDGNGNPLTLRHFLDQPKQTKPKRRRGVNPLLEQFLGATAKHEHVNKPAI